MEYTQEYIDTLVDELQKELGLKLPALAKSEESSVSGSEGSKPAFMKDEAPPTDDKPSDSSPSKDSSGSSGSEPAPEPKPDDSAPAPDASAQPQDAQGSDPAALAQAYDALSDEDLHAHYQALMQVVKGRMGAAGPDAAGASPSVAPDASAAPAPASAGPSPSPAAPAPAMKAEAAADKHPVPPTMKEGKESGSPDLPPTLKPGKDSSAPELPPTMTMKKNESEEMLKSEVEDLKNQLGKVTEVLEKLLTPTQRSVTSLAELRVVAKNETPAQPVYASLKKSEITEKLNKAALDPKTSSQDRQLIIGFATGSVTVEKIQHLLK